MQEWEKSLIPSLESSRNLSRNNSTLGKQVDIVETEETREEEDQKRRSIQDDIILMSR